MAEKMSDEAASGRVAAKAEEKNHHCHRHYHQIGGTAEKMSGKDASGRPNTAATAAKAEEKNHHRHRHHHHHRYFLEQHSRDQSAPPAGRKECEADIDDCADGFIKHNHRQFEMEWLDTSVDQTYKEVPIDSRR